MHYFATVMTITRKTSLQELTQEKVSHQLTDIVKAMQETEQEFAPQLSKLHDNF